MLFHHCFIRGAPGELWPLRILAGVGHHFRVAHRRAASFLVLRGPVAVVWVSRRHTWPAWRTTHIRSCRLGAADASRAAFLAAGCPVPTLLVPGPAAFWRPGCARSIASRIVRTAAASTVSFEMASRSFRTAIAVNSTTTSPGRGSRSPVRGPRLDLKDVASRKRRTTATCGSVQRATRVSPPCQASAVSRKHSPLVTTPHTFQAAPGNVERAAGQTPQRPEHSGAVNLLLIRGGHLGEGVSALPR